MAKRLKKVRVCSRCGEPVLKEEKKALNGYPFVCPNCDENMFTFETKLVRRIMRSGMKDQKTKERKKEIKRPKVGELRIRILYEKKKDADGNWLFAPVFPRQGTSGMRIHAKTVEQARTLLENYLSNELSCQDDIWENQ